MRLLQPFEKILIELLYVLLAFVFKYRRQTITENLTKSFPEKSMSEIKTISKKYYKHLAQLIVESIFCTVYSTKKVMERCSFEPKTKELLDRCYENKQSLILVMGHWGNWELSGLSFCLNFKHQLNVIYHPIKNRWLNDFMKKTRERFGAKAIAMDAVFKEMFKRKGEINATAFIADQSPPPEGAIWCNFLNQDTPFFRGPGVLSKKLNLPVFYARLLETEKNNYQIQFELISEAQSTMSPEEIIARFAELLERDIKLIPQNWIWSHKRWKHKRPFA